LSSALQLASPGARIEYSDEGRRVIDDIVSEITVEPVIGIASGS